MEMSYILLNEFVLYQREECYLYGRHKSINHIWEAAGYLIAKARRKAA